MNFNKENVIKEIKKAKSLAFENCVVSEIPIRYLDGVLNAIELMEDPFDKLGGIHCIGYDNRCICKRCKERSLYESFGNQKMAGGKTCTHEDLKAVWNNGEDRTTTIN